MAHPTSPDDILVWADGTYAYRSQLSEMTHLSDDYEVLYLDSEEWIAFDPSNPLKRALQ